jgi:3-oxoacyl-[acyl-carrier protein] reductase
MEFQDRVAVVTGGSRGIGRAIVQALAREGAKVAFTYAQNKALADEVANGDNIVAYQVDSSDFNQAKEFIKQVKERWNTIDVVVNNAGITRDKLTAMMSEKDWDDVIDTNLKGVFNITKPAVGVMIRQRRGAILNITSISGIVGLPGQVNYSASKAGVIGFTKALAKELAKAGITVNALAPGFVETDMTAALKDEYKAKLVEQVPLGRTAKPEEIAAVALFLVSGKAAYITGQVLQVDGGLAI